MDLKVHVEKQTHQGCQVSFRTSRRNVGLFLRSCSGQGPHLAMMREPSAFSRVVAGFSNYEGELRLPLVLAQGSPCCLFLTGLCVKGFAIITSLNPVDELAV